jgi:hypothetical protein
MSESFRPWIWPGIFKASLPPAWNQREVDGLLEIVPEKPVGAIHIRILDRTRPGQVEQTEAAELISEFATNQGVAARPTIIEDPSAPAVARASFVTSRGQQTLHWDVHAKVWEKFGIVASYVHDGKHERERSQALHVLASIEPIP